MSFLLDIEAFKDKALLAASTSANRITEEFMTKVVENTPTKQIGNYAKGLLINQWYPSPDGQFSTAVSGTINVNGSDSLSRIKSTIASNAFLGKDGVITLTNNLGYAYRAEKLGWPQGEGSDGWVWSGRQGPYAMVAKSIVYIQGKYQ